VHETGVSLGGGCLRGVAHIGALMEILKHNYSITHIAGTSAGAVIGGLYACGQTSIASISRPYLHSIYKFDQ
jgi:NTE family protein